MYVLDDVAQRKFIFSEFSQIQDLSYDEKDVSLITVNLHLSTPGLAKGQHFS